MSEQRPIQLARARALFLPLRPALAPTRASKHELSSMVARMSLQEGARHVRARLGTARALIVRRRVPQTHRHTRAARSARKSVGPHDCASDAPYRFGGPKVTDAGSGRAPLWPPFCRQMCHVHLFCPCCVLAVCCCAVRNAARARVFVWGRLSRSRRQTPIGMPPCSFGSQFSLSLSSL